MKSEKGITLAVLALTITMLLILSSFAIYTGMRSTEIIEIQKYKAQMQLIQNGVDELYEEYKNYCQKNSENNEDIKLYIENNPCTVYNTYAIIYVKCYCVCNRHCTDL